MSSRQPQPRRRRVLIALLLAVAATSLALVAEGLGQSSAPRVRALPLLGAADPEMTLMGSAPQGTAGEAWGYRQLPLTVGSVRAGARALEFGPTSSTRPESQLVFLRHTSVTGWQVYETPLDEGGRPYRGFSANELSARTTPRGGGVLVGRDTQRPAQAPADRPGDSPQIVVLARDPAGRYRVRPGPDEPPENGSAAPSGILAPGEALAEGAGSGRVAITAFDDGAHTGLFAAPTFAGSGPAPQPAILRNARNAGNDGFTWTREPIDAPAGVDLQVIALGATSTSNAWALAREPERVDGLPRRRGVILLQRSTDADGKPRWREADLGAQVFEDAQTPASGVLGVAPLADAAQPLTVTGNGLWIDGRLTASGVPRDFTLFYSREAARVTGSWCDASVCDRPLGARFNSRDGYRSFAWAGPGFGTRAITNGLEAGGDERTNRGTYLRFADDSDDAFERRPGGGGNFRSSGAFASVDDGWLEGPVRVGTSGPPPRPPAWPVSLRAPLADVTPQPGATPGRRGSRALAAGSDGGVARFIPGRGWQREFLLTSSGSVSKSALRGVAWPEPNRAHAVGDIGAMWQWNADTDLWEVDPGTPVAFEGNLMDVAFDRNDSDRGYAVGKSGVLLRYGKSWEQETLPAAQRGRDLTQIAFAGSQALVAAEGDLLINSGGGWRVDPGVKALLDRVRTASPRIFAVAGLPDGGAIAAGRDFVLERDGPRSPWRFSDQPLPNSTVIAAAAVRAGPRVRAVVSVAPRLPYPPPDLIDTPDPNVPPPIVPPFPLPGDGYVLRETADGWSDQQRSSFFGSDNDRPLKTDPILSFALDSAGTGWAVGGWGGDSDSAGRGSSARNADGRATRERVRTAGIYRVGSDASTPPVASARSPVPTPSGPVRLAVAGHPQCESPCTDLADQEISPDRTLTSTLERVASLRGGAGPRMLLLTGGRSRVAPDLRESRRYATLLGSQPPLPVFPAPGAADAAGDAGPFRSAFAGFNAPFGRGAAPGGISPAGIPGAAPGPGARTHYAFDSQGAGGRVRVVVIDNSIDIPNNSKGALEDSDPHQNPSEPQRPWLVSVLADARAEGIPTLVMGSRDLNTRFNPRLNADSDGTKVAELLVAGGASAYLFDRPEENRSYRIPGGSSNTIPTFATGTLGYRSPIVGATRPTGPDSLYGDAGFLMLEVDASQRNDSTNRAPVKARLIPVVEDVSLEATDGTLLRRSRPSLFRGLGRRPRSGDRWGRVAAGDGNPDPPGGDPYTLFPPQQCLVAGCSARIDPEYEFRSSDPDIADFVRQDPNSSNLRKPLLDAKDKVISSSRSGLLCPFNAGTTTVTIKAGGFSFSERITVQDGSVLRPCGTRPLDPSRFERERARSPSPATPPPPPPAGGPPASPLLPPPPAVPLLVSPPVLAMLLVRSPALRPAARPEPPSPPVPPPAVEAARVPPLVPPPPPPTVRPTPPGGVAARVYQVEEKREEEAALEESQAFSRYSAADSSPVPAYLIGLVVLAALAGAGTRVRPRPGRPAPVNQRSRP